ncbi:MAG: AEC family transporter [Clostridia bacterium]|nr:AEC family transporter [Clostridia bacterium]
MDNLLLSANVVLPLFLCMMLGYLLKCLGLIKEQLTQDLNKLSFKVFLPIYLFNTSYACDLNAAFDPSLVVFAVISTFAVFGLGMVLVPRWVKENSQRGVVIQCLFRSNFALFGMPITEALCGADRMGPSSLLISVIVPMYNILAVITLESFRGGKPDPKKILRGILTNPLIIGTMLGLVLNVLKVPLIQPMEKALTDLGRVATPLSLIALGSHFSFRAIASSAKPLLIGSLGRLVICPAVMVTLAALAGFRGEYLSPILIMFGAPVAASSFTMAQQMEGDGQLAASFVMVTSAGAIFTFFVWIFILKQLALV